MKCWEIRHTNTDFQVQAQTQGEAAELAAARLAPDWAALEDDFTGLVISAFDFDGLFMTEFSVREL